MALAAAIGLALVHQYLFYGHSFGVSYPLFLLLFYAYMWTFGAPEMRPMKMTDWLLMAVIALLSLTFVLYHNQLLRVLNSLAIPMLVFVQFTLLLSRRMFSHWDIRVVADVLDHLVPQSVRHWPTPLRLLGRLMNGSTGVQGAQQRRQASRVLIGLLVAAPLLAVILSLLSSADGVFHYVLSAFPDWLGQLSVSGWFWRIVWTGGMALLLFTYLWGFRDGVVYDWERAALGEDALKPLRTRTLAPKVDPLIATTVLVLVALVYVLYVVVQLSYLFGAWEGVLPQGLTYADYARQGFAELIALSGINLVILLGTLYLVKAGEGAMGRLIRILLLLIVGCTGVMLCSAYSRLQLYEQAYGYTYARFLAHAFMLYIGALLLLAGLRAALRRVPLGRCFIAVSLLAFLALNYAQMDAGIAAGNIERYRENGKLDEAYLLSLSTDATPLLIRFRKSDYPQLRLEDHRRWMALEQPERDWQSYNFSRRRAARELSEALD